MYTKRPALGVLSSNGTANVLFSQKNVVNRGATAMAVSVTTNLSSSASTEAASSAVLTSSSTATSLITLGGAAGPLDVFKTNSSSANNLLTLDQANSENQPPHLLQHATAKTRKQIAAAAAAAAAKQQADADFEIFQEEEAAKSKQQQQQVEEREKKLAKLENDNDDDEDESESDEEEEESDEEDEDEDEDEAQDDDEAALEEEGISRLNLAAITDPTGSSLKMINTSSHELMQIMDSSSSTHNDSASPMVLDDTIKFLSKIEDEEAEEEAESGDDEDHDAEDDEETRRNFEIQERENELMNCLEYKDDILKYMRQLEQENRPKANYMKKQLDITSSMRSILVDWLVEVCDEYKLNVETLYLAVNYTDRFLSQMSVLRGKLQLVGTAAMYIASKYEEITPPDVAEFVYITDDTYTKKQVLRMEHLMLKVLDFRMSPPTANWFLSHYLRFVKIQTSLGHVNNADLCQRVENLSRYLAELTLVDSETFLAYLPSQIAISAMYLALYTLKRPWTRQIAEICGYSQELSEARACVCDLFRAMQQADAHPQQAIQEKYKQSKYDYVALIDAPKSLPASFLTNQ